MKILHLKSWHAQKKKLNLDLFKVIHGASAALKISKELEEKLLLKKWCHLHLISVLSLVINLPLSQPIKENEQLHSAQCP